MNSPSPPLLLFGMHISVYTRIARLALEEKRVPYAFEEVEIFDSEGVPDEHFKRHPFGRIPVLRDSQIFIYETSAITRYVDEAYPGPDLQPDDPRARAKMNQAISLLDSYAYRPMVWGVFVQRICTPLEGGTPDEQEIGHSLQTAKACLDALDLLLGSSAFLAGENVSLADLHAYPILRYFCLAPEGNALLEHYPGLVGWYERMFARPSSLKTATSYE